SLWSPVPTASWVAFYVRCGCRRQRDRLLYPSRLAAVKQGQHGESRMRCQRSPVFLGRLLCREPAFPPRPTGFSRSPPAASPVFTLVPPLPTSLGEPLRW